MAVAVAFITAWLEAGIEPPPEDDRARDQLAAFRGEPYCCFTARADALSELADAVLCAEGPVRTRPGGRSAGRPGGHAPAQFAVLPGTSQAAPTCS